MLARPMLIGEGNMQAIETKYLPATNTRGSRIKATCERGSITIPYPHELSGDACHIAAADTLVAKFVEEDTKKYGSDPAQNPWAAMRHVDRARPPNPGRSQGAGWRGAACAA